MGVMQWQPGEGQERGADPELDGLEVRLQAVVFGDLSDVWTYSVRKEAPGFFWVNLEHVAPTAPPDRGPAGRLGAVRNLQLSGSAGEISEKLATWLRSATRQQ